MPKKKPQKAPEVQMPPKQKNQMPGLPPKKSLSSYIFSTLIIFGIIVGLFGAVSDYTKSRPKAVSLSEVATMVQGGEIKTIAVDDQSLSITKNDNTNLVSKKEASSSLVETLVAYGVPQDKIAKINISVVVPSAFLSFLGAALPIVLPIAVIIFLFFMLTKNAKGAGAQAFTFGQSKARITDPNDEKNKVTFKDVAGAREAKEELAEVVDFLKNPKKFLDIGAKIPKGVLLSGAPGTGKTLLARAVAGEAGVPFFHLSGSEFVEMFVGVGASRVRDLFKMAKRAAPSIIFIDEIDAVGRARGSGTGGGNDEREQTLNQILVEMDGFEPTNKVIVMAATNRGDVLDSALLRPGRFDRRVQLDLPDRRDRQEILEVHAKEKPFAEDVNLVVIAERTPGFSGADLSSLMNEGAILAARENRKKILQLDLVRSIEKVMMGPERKSHLITKHEKDIVAYHEAGHALVASVLPDADPVHKISIIARGSAGGFTMKLPLEEKRLNSSKEFLDDLAMSMGGYAAEKLVFGDITTGPSGDLQSSANLARAMVTKWGMSERVGPVALQNGIDYSEKISDAVDSEVERIMKEARDRATAVLTKHRSVLDVIAAKLIEVETLEQADYEEILVAHGIPLKKKED